MDKERRVKGGERNKKFKEERGGGGKEERKRKGTERRGEEWRERQEKFKKDPKTMITYTCMSALTSLTLPITTKKVLQVLDI